MSKTLTLIRHGKSSWEYKVDDHDRPLKKRAYNDIKCIADEVKTKISENTFFFSSSANRAQTTARLFLKHLDFSPYRLKVLPELYTFDHKVLRDIIHKMDDDFEDVVIFGHNPAFTQLANAFGDEQFFNIPTSGLVRLSFENTQWKDCRKARTVLHLFPKNLR
jgi:phosphohistidine phosphatase